MKLKVKFYATLSGREPVREWLRSLPREERKIIGDDIKTAQFGWPLGMPLIRKLDKDLWEVRSNLGNRIARTIFTVEGNLMVLLHGFIKRVFPFGKPRPVRAVSFPSFPKGNTLLRSHKKHHTKSF